MEIEREREMEIDRERESARAGEREDMHYRAGKVKGTVVGTVV